MPDTTEDDRWRRVDTLFAAALERRPEERSAFLDAECSDPEVRERVEALLRAENASTSFLDRREAVPRALAGIFRDEGAADGADPSAGPPAADRVGERVGPYVLDGLLGQGGMATVYRARRVDGGFEQQVAVKVIRGDLSSDEVIRRFRSEREILSGLRHPNIARLLDGGATDDGLPYLVMDPVDGVPVTDYCEGRGMDVEGRLWLFLEIARAVGYAHRNLVVHRDLKPSNILVTDDGRPMLLDFGIAKLLTEEAPDAGTTLTRARWRTPGYAAPEQIRGETVTTATDVHQLGVLLFELLTGRRPFPVEGRSLYATEKAICEGDPPRPSQVAGTGSGRLRGDLDAIVLEALRKEPEERYPSVEAMAADVRRHLTAEPVEARRGSRGYRTRTFVRRNRGKVAAAAGFLLLVGIWAVTATVQGARLAAERDRATSESEKAAQVTTFLTSLLEAEDPREAQGDTVTVRQVLERGVERIGQELEGQPDVQAELYLTTGTVYESLGAFAAADSLLERALSIRRELYGEGPDEELAEVQVQLGRLRLEQGRFDEAEPLMRSALEQRTVLNPEGSEAIADDMVEVAEVLRSQDRHDEAEPLYGEALAMYEALDSPPRVSIAITMNNLALAYHETGRLARAMPLYEEATVMLRDTLGARHPYTLILQHNLAGFNRSLGRYATADSIFREVIAAEREVVPGSADLAASIANLGMTLRLRGWYDEAAEALEEALELQQPLGPTHPSVTLRMRNLAYARMDQGRYEEARMILEDFARRRLEAAGPTGDITALQDLGVLHRKAGRHGEARDVLGEALARRREQSDPPHPGIAEALEELALARWAEGNLDGAAESLGEALEMRRALGGDDLAVAGLLTRLAGVRREGGELDEADRLLAEADTLVAAFPPGTVHRAELAVERARVLLARGEAGAALEILREVRPWYDRQFSDVHRGRAEVLGVEGQALVRLGRLEEAEPVLLASDAVLRDAPPPYRSDSAARLAELYEAADREGRS